MAGEERKPNKERVLTPEEKKRAAAWVARHAKHGCPVCGNTKWNLGQEFVEIHQHTGNVFRGGNVYPLVMLLCSNCAYVLLFHAITTGVMALPKEAEENVT
jgi:predicted nucleic-acid-binding Zn-ribbon protein